MPINYPGPYEVEMSYMVSSLTHKLRFSCTVQGTPAVGEASANVLIIRRGGTTASFESVVGTFWGFLRPLFHTGVTFVGATIWKYTPNTYERTFISSIASSLPNGISATAPSLAAQCTFTFRSGSGGVAKVIILESSGVGTAKTALIANSAGTSQQKLANYLVSTDSPVIARDNGFLVAPMYQLDGQNEAVFRKRYR